MPTIGTVNGRLSIRIDVRQGADATAAIVDVLAYLCGGSAASNTFDNSMRLKVSKVCHSM